MKKHCDRCHSYPCRNASTLSKTPPSNFVSVDRDGPRKLFWGLPCNSLNGITTLIRALIRVLNRGYVAVHQSCMRDRLKMAFSSKNFGERDSRSYNDACNCRAYFFGRNTSDLRGGRGGFLNRGPTTRFLRIFLSGRNPERTTEERPLVGREPAGGTAVRESKRHRKTLAMTAVRTIYVRVNSDDEMSLRKRHFGFCIRLLLVAENAL